MGKGRRCSQVDDEKPIGIVEGWEDGERYTRHVTKLDRWELQSADRLTLHIGGQEIVLVQDPHSNHLGGYIWLTAIVFCTYLDVLHAKRARHEWISLARTKRWVELGSGIGLLGIMLHKLGVEDVVVTDIEELIPVLEKNVEANGIGVKSISGRRKNPADDSNAIIVEPLLWNDDDAIKHVKSAGEIDYVLACDCIYSEASAVDLVETMDKLCSEKTTVICISEVRNQAAQERFVAEAMARFEVELVPAIQWQKKVTQIAFDETLNLYRLRKPKSKPKLAKTEIK
ncbi:hypothetical protein DFQ28_003696 [Apophysomyces sp. BC1034]|nr:hypothetical protein DFQ30_003694 [Apophysomyces sp. BC1015]KAG0179040.1 hypothetical protein DFQ29_002687 [Apophysomyces sp. BC1021]KAG0189232.1 hypothetical protein DFQ28_003696 [Apophysomyces sp. BC1034]